MKKINTKQSGLNLLEMMLVIVIMIALGMMALRVTQTKMIDARIERTADQIQQILQAATSYYIDYHAWPETMSDLITNNYLPDIVGNQTFPSPWGLDDYTLSQDASATERQGVLLNVSVTLPNQSYAAVLRGKLPLAKIEPATTPIGPASTAGASTHYIVTSSINIPGYIYNRITSRTSLAGNGQCVAAPICPDGMSPKIYLAPSVLPGYVKGTAAGTLYNLQAFFAVARGGTGGEGVPVFPENVAGCGSFGDTLTAVPCTSLDSDSNHIDLNTTTQKYWRACLYAMTSEGPVLGAAISGYTFYLVATTQCVPDDPASSSAAANAI